MPIRSVCHVSHNHAYPHNHAYSFGVPHNHAYSFGVPCLT